MIDVVSESLLRIPIEASKAFPGRPNASTIWRWHRSGVKGVRLETVVVGSRRYTSREAIQRFIERTTAAADGHHRLSLPKSGERSLAAAERELDAAGI
jgi:hypothetical protein